MALIDVDHLVREFPGNPPVKVLKGLSFSAREKELISVVGASGAGKSTFLQIVGTLDRPSSGSVLINNTNPFSLSQSALARFRNATMGFIFQFHHLLPEFTASENVMLPLLIRGETKNKASERAGELLSRLGLSERLHHKPAALSGGEQQRVAVARALALNPPLVLADEPSGNLDTKNAANLHRLFQELKEEYHTTFVVVTHNEHLASIADRKLVMEDGLLHAT
jgi:lipoprotein-releasing system ATP-binding protein